MGGPPGAAARTEQPHRRHRRGPEQRDPTTARPVHAAVHAYTRSVRDPWAIGFARLNKSAQYPAQRGIDL